MLCRGGPHAGKIARYDYISGGMIDFEDADCSVLVVYLVTEEVTQTPSGAIPIAEFVGEHEIR